MESCLKKRLLRTAEADEHVYTFESTWAYNVYTYSDEGYETFDYNDQYHYGDQEILDEARATVNTYMNDDPLDPFLEEHLGIVGHLHFELKDERTCVTTLTTAEELTDKQVADIVDWLTGQFSDGAGEGLEQQVCYEEHDDEQQWAIDNISFEDWCTENGYDVPDEEDDDGNDALYDEYQNDRIDVRTTISYFVCLWPKDFAIRLVQRT